MDHWGCRPQPFIMRAGSHEIDICIVLQYTVIDTVQYKVFCRSAKAAPSTADCSPLSTPGSTFDGLGRMHEGELLG